MKLLSRSEELLLLAIWRLQDDAYGMAIQKHLEKLTGESWPISAIYVPLRKFERRNFVRAFHGPSSPERGGRSKRFFRLTPTGLDALRHTRKVHEAAWAELPNPAFGGEPSS